MDRGMNCSTCHWWTEVIVEEPRRACVLLTGLKDTPTAPVKFGGMKPLMTIAAFSCAKWERDRRKEIVE